MKKKKSKVLVVSMKSLDQVFSETEEVMTKLQKKQKVDPKYGISFNDPKMFKKFVKNMMILLWIRKFQPESIYDLSKILDMDMGNLSRLISFFETCGVVEIETYKKGKQTVKKPVVSYDEIKFDLAA